MGGYAFGFPASLYFAVTSALPSRMQDEINGFQIVVGNDYTLAVIARSKAMWRSRFFMRLPRSRS